MCVGVFLDGKCDCSLHIDVPEWILFWIEPDRPMYKMPYKLSDMSFWIFLHLLCQFIGIIQRPMHSKMPQIKILLQTHQRLHQLFQ